MIDFDQIMNQRPSSPAETGELLGIASPGSMENKDMSGKVQLSATTDAKQSQSIKCSLNVQILSMIALLITSHLNTRLLHSLFFSPE